MVKKTYTDRETLQQVAFRMKASEVEELTKIFENNGLLFSQGMRKLCKDFIAKKGKI